MSRAVLISCSVCDRQKGEFNSWFALDPGRELIILRAEDVPRDMVDRYDDICGESCLVKAISAWCAGVAK